MQKTEYLRLTRRAKIMFNGLSALVYMAAFVLAFMYNLEMVFLIAFLVQWGHSLKSHTLGKFKKNIKNQERDFVVNALIRESLNPKKTL